MDASAFIAGLVVLLFFLTEKANCSCARKIDHCQKAKERFSGDQKVSIKPSDPLLMVRRHDDVSLGQLCSSQKVLTEVVECMGHAFKSRTCRRDIVYGKVSQYYDSDRTIQGMEYFCKNYEVVKQADACIKAPNDELIKCRRRQVATMGRRIQSGRLDNSLICGVTQTKIGCVQQHLRTACGDQVVDILVQTMALSVPKFCDQFKSELEAEKTNRNYENRAEDYKILRPSEDAGQNAENSKEKVVGNKLDISDGRTNEDDQVQGGSSVAARNFVTSVTLLVVSSLFVVLSYSYCQIVT